MVQWWIKVHIQDSEEPLARSNARDTAPLLCINNSLASAWLNVCRSGHLNLQLTSSEFVVPVKWCPWWQNPKHMLAPGAGRCRTGSATMPTVAGEAARIRGTMPWLIFFAGGCSKRVSALGAQFPWRA